MAVLVPLLTIVYIVVNWSVTPEFKVSEIFCYVYTGTLVHSHVALWFVMCYTVIKTTRHLMSALLQVTNIILSQFHIL